MTDHVAEQIVAAGKTAITNLTTTGARVYDSRVYPVQDAELPCVLIDQGSEESELVGVSGGLLERAMELVIVACVKQGTSYRTDVNKIRKEVEVALSANQSIGGAKYVIPRAFDIELSGDAETPVARGTMTFEVKYFTTLAAPDTAI